MSHHETLWQIIEDLKAALPDADKFDLGSDRAAVRLRRAALDGVKRLGQLRKDVQTERKARQEG